MSAAFTPGPWHYGDEDERIVGGECVDIHAGEYCSPSYRCIASAESPFVNGEFGPLDEESRANARLIAAAPELYEALVYFAAYHGSGGHVGDPDVAADKACAALAKARGEQ